MRVKVYDKRHNITEVYFDDNIEFYNTYILDLTLGYQGNFTFRTQLDSKLIKFWTTDRGDVLVEYSTFDKKDGYTEEDRKIGNQLWKTLECTNTPISKTKLGEPYIKLSSVISDKVIQFIEDYRRTKGK